MIWFILLVIDLTLADFVLMMEKGATTLKVNMLKALEHSAIFAFVASVMYIVGYFLADVIFGLFGDSVVLFHRYFTMILFIIVGLKGLLVTAYSDQFVEKLNNELTAKKSFKDAIISGIDCFIVGVGASYFSVPYLWQIAIIFFVPLIALYIALYVGYYHGAAFQKVMRYICAFVYLVLSILIVTIA